MRMYNFYSYEDEKLMNQISNDSHQRYNGNHSAFRIREFRNFKGFKNPNQKRISASLP